MTDDQWALDVPIEILRGLESGMTVPPRGRELLAASSEFATEDVAPQLTGASDRRVGLARRMRPHLAVLSGATSAETAFGRWVLAQTPCLHSLVDDDLTALSRWPRLGGLSIHQSRLSGNAIENLAAALPGLRRLRVVNCTVKAPFWERLRLLRNIEELDVDPKGVGEGFVESLLAMSRLRSLRLPGRTLSPAGIARLAQHPTLEDLDTSPVDDAALMALAGATSLRKLRTYRPTVTDEGLKKLAGMKTRLREILFMTAGKLTDEGAAALATMSQLTHLHISSAKISNKGVEELAKLTGLVELDIGSCTKVNDKAAHVLAGMRGLKMLRITSTKITPEGLAVIGKGLGNGCNLVTRG